MKKMLKRMKPISVLMLVMLFMLSVICGAAAEGGAGQSGTNELDGSKIEGIYLEWVTEDSTLTAEGDPVPDSEFADKDHLYLSTTNNGEITMVYRIEAQFSGQYDYAPGDVTISIPAQVWPARAYIDGVGGVDSGSLQGTLEMPVPEAPSTKADFNWQLVDDQYVLTNTGTLSAASSVSIEVAIRGLNPIDIVDMSTCNDITAYCELRSTPRRRLPMWRRKARSSSLLRMCRRSCLPICPPAPIRTTISMPSGVPIRPIRITSPTPWMLRICCPRPMRRYRTAAAGIRSSM